MFDFHGPRLTVSKELISRCPRMAVIGILHALTDTQEFLTHLLNEGHDVRVIFAKPYSKNPEVIIALERLGIKVEQLDYGTLEGTSILRETIMRELNTTSLPLMLIDVGGYFLKPLLEMQSEVTLPRGIVEVTTFGHKRYLNGISGINVPLVSIARSPIKDVEAVFVGESAWFAIDRILRDVGMSAFGRRVGIVGYGMIGMRVAAVAQANGAHTQVFDRDPLQLLKARSFKQEIQPSLEKMLQSSEIVISVTGDTAVLTQEIVNARDGILLASAGSKLQEIDVSSIKKMAKSVRRLSDLLVEYEMPSGKRVYVLRDGAAVNFLLGSCPDQTMDLVFAEIVQACQSIMEDNLEKGMIHEVSNEKRQEIASDWLRLQA